MKFFPLAASFLSIFSAVSAARAPAGVMVNLRVEGISRTIFEGNIFTTAKSMITTASGGSHHCDGTNNHANVNPGPTCTGALVDARTVSFDGTYDAAFDDYFITTIGGDAQTATQFWGILRNYQFTPVGGCQQQVTQNDNILFAYDAFSRQGFLKLAITQNGGGGDPQNGSISQGRKISVLVTNGGTGTPVAGANIYSWNGGMAGHVLGTTDATGVASITSNVFKTSNLFNGARLKAELTGYLRSNSVSVTVRGRL